MKTIETIQKQIASLERALAAHAKGLLGTRNGYSNASCVYLTAEGKMCGVGVMLSDETHAMIIDKGWNERGISFLFNERLGEKIQDETGFGEYELVEFQNIHDSNNYNIEILVEQFKMKLENLYNELAKAIEIK